MELSKLWSPFWRLFAAMHRIRATVAIKWMGLLSAGLSMVVLFSLFLLNLFIHPFLVAL